MVEYYDQRASELERVYEKPERQAQLVQLKETVRSMLAGRHVLETACGTGYWTQVASETAASITAFDISESMLAIAQGKGMDPERVTFLAGDVYQFPELPRSFDGALVAFLWSHIPKTRLNQLLHDLCPALEPGAVVIFIDNAYVEGDSTSIARRDADGNTFQVRRLESGKTFEVIKNYPTEQELRAAVANVADRVEVKWLKHYWCMICKFA
jgi:ubiquinone/menaquinone biosynthesis C-methylase UbiE